MELKWLDDLVALAEAKTLTLAAEQRNVSQPAFSRRIQQIEQWLGAPVLDRTRRPARVTPAIQRKIVDIRMLKHEFLQIRNDVRNWEESQRRLAIAAQHSISVNILPPFIAWLLGATPRASIRLRSANRDECYSLLMTRQVAMIVTYETESLPLAANETLLQKVVLREDSLCPVASPSLAAVLQTGGAETSRLPIIAFPPDVFLGAVLERSVLPRLREQHLLHVACEAALVPAVKELALASVGVAWLPRAACVAHFQSGDLVDLGEQLGSARMNVVAARITTPHTRLADSVWNQLCNFPG